MLSSKLLPLRTGRPKYSLIHTTTGTSGMLRHRLMKPSVVSGSA
ncbi:hypothetical protein [Magnetospirillum molischianum]|nr:hypothetical protein [Magnetospirillum molischianum]